jgi:hypothetical protein
VPRLRTKSVGKEAGEVANRRVVGDGPLLGADFDGAQLDAARRLLVLVERLAAQAPQQAGLTASAVAGDHDLEQVELAVSAVVSSLNSSDAPKSTYTDGARCMLR